MKVIYLWFIVNFMVSKYLDAVLSILVLFYLVPLKKMDA